MLKKKSLSITKMLTHIGGSAICKEHKHVKIAFKKIQDGGKAPPGFEVKFDLRRKVRYVASSNMTNPYHL